MKTKMYIQVAITVFVLIGFSKNLMAQTNIFPLTGAAGIGTTTPNASSLLEIKSTKKGFLPPRMTRNQRDAIATPATGLLIYQTNATPGFYYYNGTTWKPVAPVGSTSSDWSLTGNTGTDSSVNFLGTKDAHPLVFRVNNKKSGYIDNSAQGNTSLGYQGLLANTTGFGNTVMGYNSLKANTIGSRNTAIGFYTLVASNADNNTAIGTYALNANTSGTANVATGVNALQGNVGGINNSAYGTNSLYTNTTGQQNTATGYAALYSNNNGNYNSAHGTAALNSNTSGSWNTANGAYAMYQNTTSYYNTAIGGNALYSNTLGTSNTAIGYNSLYNSTASYNIAVGAGSLYSNTTGNNNTAIGVDALHFNTTGGYNTAFGNDALLSNTTASGNTGIGYYALESNTTGAGNTALGNSSLNSNTTGNYNTANGTGSLNFNQTGIDNTANGYYALYSNNGSDNTADGFGALSNNSDGYNNTASGSHALSNTTSGYNNAAFGLQALLSNINGIGNTAIGVAADVTSGSLQSATAIGYYASCTASNQVRIGSVGGIYNSDPTSIGGKVGWSTLSDGRVKKNIKENVPGLLFINKLKPITYNIDNDAVNKIAQRSIIKDKDGKEIKPSADALAAGKANTAIVYTGFVAQDVEKAAKSLNYDFSGVDAAKSEKDLYGLRYSDFVVPLVKAVQELSKMNNDKDAKIDDLQKQIDELKAMIVSNQSTANSQQSTVLSSALLQQNIPNPFNNTTTINYTLPQKFSSAKIVITDKSGKTLKAINLSDSKGNVKVDASTLVSGAYQYSLIVDGKLIATKQMEHLK